MSNSQQLDSSNLHIIIFRLGIVSIGVDDYLQCTGWSAKTIGDRAAMQAAANVFNAPNIFINFNNFYNCIRLFLKIDT